MLTANFVKTVRARGYYHDSKGLYLRVSARGSKYWCYRYRRGGKLHEFGIGSADLFNNLEEVRAKHQEARRALKLDAVDPIDARRASKAAQMIAKVKTMSFRECAEAYIRAHQAGWRNARHREQWPNTLETYVFPVMGALPVEAVDVGLVMRALEPIWQAKPETASRVRGRIESSLDWATVRGYRRGENPARWRGHLENLLPARRKVARVVHHPALPYAELPAFMRELRSMEGVAERALEFAILTVGRTGEVVGARWTEIDLAERLWTIPAERMKGGREHRVPLSSAAMALLDWCSVVKQGERVFPWLSKGGMLAVLGRLRPGLTVHGFRSTFSDWCAERTNFPSEVREMALAHAVGDRVVAAYRRGDLFEKRRGLAEAWARWAEGGEGEVVAFPIGMAR